MVDDEIDNHANAALPAAMGEFDKITKRAVAWVHAIIIGDVIAIVLAG